MLIFRMSNTMYVILFCLVVGISDGDTLTARCGEPGDYGQVKIRIAAIDAPEKRQPYFDRSRKALSDLCFKETAKLTVRSKDRYGRTVADVECKGKDVATEQVKNGLAWVYPKYAKHHQHLYPLQDIAKKERRFLWGDKNPIAPWEWRRGMRD